MKFIMPLIAVVALSFVTSVFAQEEESPSPSPSSDEKASATVEAKPSTSTSSEEPKAQKKEEPAAQKKEEPAAQKSPAAQKKEATVTTAAPASGKKMSTEASLRDMENRWENAISKHEVATVEAMVAADFVGVSPKFKFVNKSGMLAEFKSNKDTYKSAKNEALRVTSFGPNVAVVTGRSREKGTGKDGKSFDRTYYFTDTWMQRSGQWQCIGSQAAEARK